MLIDVLIVSTQGGVSEELPMTCTIDARIYTYFFNPTICNGHSRRFEKLCNGY